MKERMDTINSGDYRRWGRFKMLEDRLESICAVQGTENFVYLSADASDVLKEIDPSKSYIIGGLVDRNRHKVANSVKAPPVQPVPVRLEPGFR